MRNICAAAVLLVLVACATPYQRQGMRGGFSDYPLDVDTYVVTFKGNGYTSRERVEMFVHYRCAELTLETGHDSFIVVDGRNADRLAAWTTPGQATTTTNATVTGYGNAAYGSAQSTTTYTPPTTTVIRKPGQSVTVRMFKGEKPDGAFDAKSVVNLLGSRVQ